MSEINRAERERQRFEHLVLERPRPKASELKRPREMPKAIWKVRRDELQKQSTQLLPGIEEHVALREAWGGGKGTPQTLERADRARKRAGCLARLHETGTVTSAQLKAALEIAETYDAIASAVSIRSSFGFDRVDCGFRPENAGDVLTRGAWLELLYTRWRGVVERLDLVLAIVIGDVALTAAARDARVSDRRARVLLVDALDLWIAMRT